LPVLAVHAIDADDAVLVRQARDGDRPSFGRLYERHRRLVHAVLLSYVPFSDVEDLAQEAFLRALENLHHLRDDTAFGSWLAAIARRLALDHIRRVRVVVEANELNCGSSSPDEAALALDAVRRLPPAYRETLMMRLVEGMTGPEIAARTGLRPESVRVNLCRGMKLLRAQLGISTHG
jgi:RNA polymerase sigma-70 factor (ECF subfamily)